LDGLCGSWEAKIGGLDSEQAEKFGDFEDEGGNALVLGEHCAFG
jgi:hypothetical protein